MQVISSMRINSVPQGELLLTLLAQDSILHRLVQTGLYRLVVEHEPDCPIFRGFNKGMASCRCSPDLLLQRLEVSQEGEGNHD